MLLLWRFLPVSATQFQWIGLCGHHFASIMRKVLSGHWCNSVLNWRKEKKVPCSGSNQKMHKLITGPNVYIFMAIWKQYLWREAVESIKRSIVWIANHLTDRLIFKGPLSETFPWIEISIVALILFYRHGSPGNVNTANNKFKLSYHELLQWPLCVIFQLLKVSLIATAVLLAISFYKAWLKLNPRK